jgi:alcohol dehydrogenase
VRFIDQSYSGAIDHILEEEQTRCILLVTCNSSYEHSPAKPYFDDLAQHYCIRRYHNLGSNPNYIRLSQALDDLRGFVPDLIIALGGGSVIDYAKLISLYSRNPDIYKYSFERPFDINPISPIVAIPTTAGSGSEATHFAVLYKNGVKYSISHPSMLPSHVVIDPVLSKSMPPYITACTGMDALCQGIESLWANDATDESRDYATRSLDLIVPNIEIAVNSPTDASRRAMALGAFYAGVGISISKTTGPHAMSYFLTDRFGVPHGEAVGMMMDAFIERNYDYLPMHVTDVLSEVFGAVGKKEIMRCFSDIKKSIRLRNDIQMLGMDEYTREQYISAVNIERLGNNPGPTVTKLDMKNIIGCN